MSDTYRALEYIQENPNPNLSLAINSNLGVDYRLVQKIASNLKKISENKNVKDITIYTSLDTFGKQAEYVRHGLNLNLFDSNLNYILSEIPDLKVSFMCTFSLLSIPNFRNFLEYILILKNKYLNQYNQHDTRVILDISYLKEPHFMRASLANNHLKDIMRSDLNFMVANSSINTTGIGFSEYELNKMQRLVNWVNQEVDQAFLALNYKDFITFFTEHDKRRNGDIKSIFPELNYIWSEALHSD